jgi:hypothetical protein
VKGRHEHRFADFVGDHGEALAISIPGGEARVIRYFQERMPYGLFVPGKGASGRTYLAGRSASTLTNKHLVTDATG